MATRDARVLCPTVSNNPASTVLYPRGAATLSNYTTLCARIRTTRFVHQRVTRNNNPFAPFKDDDKPDGHDNDPDTNRTADNVRIHAGNHTVPTRTHPLPIATIQQTCPARPAPTTRTRHSAVTPHILGSSRALQLTTQQLATPPPVHVPPVLPPLPPPTTLTIPTPGPTRNPTKIPYIPTIQHPLIFPPTKQLPIPPRYQPSAFIQPNVVARDDITAKRPASPPLQMNAPHRPA